MRMAFGKTLAARADGKEKAQSLLILGGPGNTFHFESTLHRVANSVLLLNDQWSGWSFALNRIDVASGVGASLTVSQTRCADSDK